MLGKGMTISEAAHRWVGEFSRFPHSMIEKLISCDPDEWTEVTTPSHCDRVYLFSIPDEDVDGNEYEGSCQEGEIVRIEDDEYIIELHDGTEVRVEISEFEVEKDGFLPMWGTLWQFGDSCDDYWLEEMGGIKIMSECGFRVYESYEFGYFFGIDGAGYDFYENHWIPLYKARGLQWHDPETEKGAE